MGWINYFIALGLPIWLTLFTFLLAVVFKDSVFIKKIFLLTLFFSVCFELIWFFIGLALAIRGMLNGW